MTTVNGSAVGALKESVWRVIGCSSGAGKALSVALQARGLRLVATGRNVEALRPDNASGVIRHALYEASVPSTGAKLNSVAADLDRRESGAGRFTMAEVASPTSVANDFLALYARDDKSALLALCASDAVVHYVPWGDAGVILLRGPSKSGRAIRRRSNTSKCRLARRSRIAAVGPSRSMPDS